MKRVASRDVLLQVESVADAAAFYGDVLRMQVFLRTPGLVGLDAGSFRLFLEEAAALGPVFEFFTDDLEEGKAQLRGRGCVLIAEDPTVPKCYFRDPFGMILNLRERAEADKEDDAEPIRDAEPPPHY